MGPIQRYPLGFLESLSIKGVAAPSNLSETIVPTLDMTQFYGTPKVVVANNNGALAENTSLALVPAPSNWIMLFGITLTCVKTATMTALRMVVAIRFNSDPFQEISFREDSFEPFGATETGTVTCAHWMPYPLVCPPNTMLLGRMSILGTDATANCTLGGCIAILA